MPTYAYRCPRGGPEFDRCVAIDLRDKQICYCGAKLERLLAAPLFRISGQITPGGGPDKFTADMLGVPLKELPEGLKAGK